MNPREAERDAEVPRGAISKVCFAVAACAFAAAGLGTLINLVFAGWIAVSGMVALGLFYTALGLLNFTPGGTSRSRTSAVTAAEESAAPTEPEVPVIAGTVLPAAAVRKSQPREPVVTAAAESHPT